jgi:DNA-binding transcriptional MocR family regulator
LRQPISFLLSQEVAAEVAVNPNTIMKAYWQLEHEGLVEGRQGVGTFVARRPAGPPPATRHRLARPGALGAGGPRSGARRRRHRLHGARDAGQVEERGNRMTAQEAPAIRTAGLGKRLRVRMGAAGLLGVRAARPGQRAGRA